MERVVDKQKEINRIQQEMIMIRRVQRGETVKCPVCGIGVLEKLGPRILCNNNHCKFEYTLDY